MEVVRENLVLLCFAAFYALLCTIGYRRGFIMMVASFASAIAAAVLARMLMPKAAAFMMANNSWINWVQTEVLPLLNGVTLEQILSAVSFIVIFLIALALVKVLAATLDRISKVPVLNFVNKSLGLLFGAAEATVYAWVFMLFLTITPHLEFSRTVLSQISSDNILSVLYKNNMLASFLAGIIK